MNKLTLITLFLFSFCIQTFAQDCNVFPADCPDEGSIENSQNKSARLGNGILPQEIAMQDKMRTLVSQMVNDASKSLHWDVMELDEYTNLGPFQSAGTAYPLRSPRSIGIAFQFIVNKDSLEAWRNWLQEFNNRYQKAMTNSFQSQKDIENSSAYQDANDSAKYYLNLRIAYMNAHKGAYFSEDKRYNYLQKKQEYFLDQLDRLSKARDKSSTNSVALMDKENTKRTNQFRNRTLVQVFFEFNSSAGLINEDDSDPQTKDIEVPGTLVAKFAHLPNPDLNSLLWHFHTWENMEVLLLGHWILKPSDQNYAASFTRGGQDDEHTPKKIKSDQVQTVAIHIMGNKNNMDRLLKQLDIKKLDSVIQ